MATAHTLVIAIPENVPQEHSEARTESKGEGEEAGRGDGVGAEGKG